MANILSKIDTEGLCLGDCSKGKKKSPRIKSINQILRFNLDIDKEKIVKENQFQTLRKRYKLGKKLKKRNVNSIKSKQKFFQDKLSVISQEKKSLISSFSNPHFVHNGENKRFLSAGNDRFESKKDMSEVNSSIKFF